MRQVPIISKCIEDVETTIYSTVVSLFSSKILPDYRQVFKDIDISSIKHGTPRVHSHPNAARDRCIANLHIRQFISKIGLTQYSVSPSRSELNNKVSGLRKYYHAKDLQMSVQFDKIGNSVLTMTDVDYYVNVNKFLNGSKLLVYTFTPRSIAGETLDGRYCVNNDNTITLEMNGGARYTHPLWDYNHDHIVVDHWWGSVIYLVERIKTSEDRSIVYFNPIRKVYGPIGWTIKGERLYRQVLLNNGVCIRHTTATVKLEDKTVDRIGYSLARPGQFISVFITDDALETARIRIGSTKLPHVSDVERIMNTFRVENPVFAASLLFDILRSKVQFDAAFEAKTTDIHSFQSLTPLVLEDGKPTMRSLWPGYLKSFAPVKSFNNDQSCYDGRLLKPKNLRPTIPPIYFDWRDEFLRYLIPNDLAHTLAPEDFEFMYHKFDRPSQRTTIEQQQETFMGPLIARSFQKAEAYLKLTNPRNITTCSMGHNFILGQFMYPFMSGVLKRTTWYAFGQHPKALADKMLDQFRNSSMVLEADASRMDGSIRGFFRDLLVSAFTRSFPEVYAEEIIRLERKERHVQPKMTFGQRYDADSTILSGSIITSVLGTLTNAFIHYASLRNIYNSEESWKRMGRYGGDDGVTPDLDPKILESVSSVFGLLYEGNVVKRGMPMKFLGRIYPDIWTSPASMIDVKRCLAKLHLTATPDIVPKELVLHRKAIGILCTDAKTPYVTAWAQAVLRLTPNANKHKLYHLTIADERYLAKWYTKTATAFYNVESEDHELCVDIATRELNHDAIDMLNFEEGCRTANRLDDLFDLPFPNDQTMNAGIEAVLGGEIIPKQDSRTQADKIRSNQEMSKTILKKGKRPDKTINKRKVYTSPIDNQPYVPSRVARAPPKQLDKPAKRKCKFGTNCRVRRCTFQH